MRRDELLDALISEIRIRKAEGITQLAGIDGVDPSGKTILADALADRGRRAGLRILRASIDGFHNPREVRYRRGPDSPEGYYRDSFDYAALRSALLDPLKAGGAGSVATRAYDFRAESPVAVDPVDFCGDTILVFEGVFLRCAELAAYWDYLVYVHAGFETTLRRAAARDAALFGSPGGAEARYRTRYIPGQRIYIRERSPITAAHAVVVNDDPEDPILVRDERTRGRLEDEASGIMALPRSDGGTDVIEG